MASIGHTIKITSRWQTRGRRPRVPNLSPTGGSLRVLFAARISTTCKSVFELLLPSKLFGFATNSTYHRHWTSRPFLLNHVQRLLTSLIRRVILAHTLARVRADAGAFILGSLVSANQRRQQLSPAAGAHRDK